MREDGTYLLTQAFDAFKRAQAIANAPKPIPHNQWDKMMLFLTHAMKFAEQAEEREPLAEITEGAKKYDAKELQAEMVLFEGKTLIQDGMPQDNVRAGIRALHRYLNTREDIEVRKLIAKAYLRIDDQDAAKEELRNIKRLHKNDLDIIDIEDDLKKNPNLGKPYSTTEDIAAAPVSDVYHIPKAHFNNADLIMTINVAVQVFLIFLLMFIYDFSHLEIAVGIKLFFTSALAAIVSNIIAIVLLHTK